MIKLAEYESIPTPIDGQIMYNDINGDFKGYYKFNKTDNTWHPISKEQAEESLDMRLKDR